MYIFCTFWIQLKEEEEKVAEKMKELEKNMKDKKAELSALIEQLENQQESLRNAPPPQVCTLFGILVDFVHAF